MAVNPDDLLIFKVREEKKKKAKPQKGPSPKAVQPPNAKVVVAQQAEGSKEDILDAYKKSMSGEKEEAGIEERKVSPNVVEEALATQMGSVPPPQEAARKAPPPKAQNPRAMAETMTCVLHPWRKGYAICSMCKRPFCYEDIVEHGGKYYCLDDVQKVPKEVLRQEEVKYSHLSVLSAFLFIAVLLVFVYYHGHQAAVMIGQLKANGLQFFFSNLVRTQWLYLLEMAVALLSFLAAVLVLMEMRHSFTISTMISLSTVVIFSYAYIQAASLADGAVVAISFFAMVTLAYSRVYRKAESTDFEEASFQGSQSNY